MDERRDLDVGGTTLAIHLSGPPDAPPVVLLHGLGEQASDWDAVAAALAPEFRVVAPDLRGHGASGRPGEYSYELMAGDVVAALDGLGYGAVRLVGHSMGALVALLIAERHPDRVERLVLEDTVPLEPTPRPPVERPDGPLPFDWPVVPAIRAQIAHPDPVWWADLPRVTAPTLVVGGGPDSHVPQDRLAAAVAVLADARLVTLPVGHHVHRGDPEGFLAALRDVL